MNYEEAGWLYNEIKQFGIGFTPKDMRKMEARQVDSTTIGLKFLEPLDTVIEDQTIVPIIGVRITMRTDRYPENPFDGQLVIDNKDLGAFENYEYLVENLNSGTEYFFSAYPYTIKDIFNLTNSLDNRVETLVKGGETVHVTAVVDEPDLFPYAYVTLTDVTTGTTKECQIMGNETIDLEVPIYHQYKITPSQVDNFSFPSETDVFTAEGDGERYVTFEYYYSKNILDVTVTADNNDGGFDSKEVTITVTNLEDGSSNSLTKTGSTNFRFAVENEKSYSISASEVEGYGTPATIDEITIVAGEIATASMIYRYNVETVNVSVSSSIETDDMTGTEIGLWLSVENVMTLSERKTYDGSNPITFHIDEGIKYYVAGITQKDGYGIPSTETFTAEATKVRNVDLQYVYNMETAKITVGCEDDGNVVGETITLHNNTANTNESQIWSGEELKFFIPNGNTYYVKGSAKTNYLTPSTGNYTAEVGNVRSINIIYRTIKDFASASWTDIRDIVRAGQAPSYFRAGDSKGVWIVQSVSPSQIKLARNRVVSSGYSFGVKKAYGQEFPYAPLRYGDECLNKGIKSYASGTGKSECPVASSFGYASGADFTSGTFTSNSARAALGGTLLDRASGWYDIPTEGYQITMYAYITDGSKKLVLNIGDGSIGPGAPYCRGTIWIEPIAYIS